MHARVFRASSTSRACASTTVRRCWLIASNRSIFAVAISKSCMVRFTSNRLNFTSDVVCTRIFGTEMAFSEYSVTVFVNSSCVIGRLVPALVPALVLEVFLVRAWWQYPEPLWQPGFPRSA